MQKPASFISIVEKTCLAFELPAQEAFDYARSLVDAKVIVPDPYRQLSITGPDQLTIKQPPEISAGTGGYINTVRDLHNSRLSPEIQASLQDGLHCLFQFSDSSSNNAMEIFKNKFVAKYDRQLVPLLQALDPAIGIGYMTRAENQSPSLLQSIDMEGPGPQQQNMSRPWSPVHALVIKKWLSRPASYDPITLTDEDMKDLKASPRLPNTFSVMFRIYEDQVYVNQAGGIAAAALSGRFSLFDHRIHVAIKDLAQMEESANPGVAFAELCHIEDLHTANIDRRESFYSYEIPIFCGSQLCPGQQILLSDLYLFYADGRLVLWSERLKKKVIPRLSSAYNYLRSDLDIFRFLCDLQYEGFDTAFQLRPRDYIPGQAFYPRIVYKKTILHLATWVIDSGIIDRLAEQSREEQISTLKTLAEEYHWPRFISLDEYDRQLVFDFESQADLLQLAILLQHGEPLTIKEYLMDANPLVKDEDAGYINEFVAAVYHKGQSLDAVTPFTDRNETRRWFVPGSEWLYYKLYIHPASANELLIEQVNTCLASLQRQGLLRQWFFVRYADPDYHLRLRLRVKPLQSGFIMTRFSKTMEELVSAGIIRKYSLDTYERELERYSPELIADCEDFFCCCTAVMIRWLEKFGIDDAGYLYYYIAYITIPLIFEAFSCSDKMSVFLMLLYESMSGVAGTKQHNENMKRKFREMQHAFSEFCGTDAGIRAWLKQPLRQFFTALQRISAKTTAWDAGRRQSILADLLHMHLNRLLTAESRQQEMILYYCMSRIFKSDSVRAGREV